MLKKHMGLGAIFMVLFISLPIFAQSTLSIDDAITLGLKKSEDLEKASLDIEKAEAQIREAWASAFPKLEASVQSIRHYKSAVIQFGDQAIRVKQDWELLTGITLNQVLYTFGKVSTALDMAKMSRALNLTVKDQVEREIRYAVEVSYYNVLLAQKLLEITKDSYTNAQNNQKALRKRFQGGRVPRFDNIKMAADVASRLPQVRNAEKNLKLAYLQLNLFTEMDNNARPQLTSKMFENFSLMKEEQSLRQKTLEGPSLRISDLNVDLLEKQAELKNADHYPSIGLFGNLNHGGTGNEMPVEEDRMFTSTSVGISLNIPLYSGGATSAQYRQAMLEKVKAKVNREKTRKDLSLSIESSIEEYKANKAKFDSAKEALRLATQAYKLTKTRFETGGATRYDLNDSENALTGARIQVETTRFELHQNKSNIKRLTEKVVMK